MTKIEYVITALIVLLAVGLFINIELRRRACEVDNTHVLVKTAYGYRCVKEAP